MLSNETDAICRAIQTIKKALAGSDYESTVKICGGKAYDDIRRLCAGIVEVADALRDAGIGGGVSQNYVDNRNAQTLQTAKDYADGKTGDEAVARQNADAQNLQAARDYTDQEVAAAKLSTQTWFPAVETFAALPATVPAIGVNYLCRVMKDADASKNGVWQSVDNGTTTAHWTPFSDNLDFVDDTELEAALAPSEAHAADTTKHITAEERAAWNAKQNALNRTVRVNLGSTSAITDNGENITPGVTGVLPAANFENGATLKQMFSKSVAPASGAVIPQYDTANGWGYVNASQFAQYNNPNNADIWTWNGEAIAAGTFSLSQLGLNNKGTYKSFTVRLWCHWHNYHVGDNAELIIGTADQTNINGLKQMSNSGGLFIELNNGLVRFRNTNESVKITSCGVQLLYGAF